MSRVLHVAPHVSLEELRRRERAAPGGERVHWQAVRLVAEGRPATEVGPLVGWSAAWVRALVHRYNALGPDALGDGQRRNGGAAPLLDAAQHAMLRAALTGPAPDAGLWTCRKVAVWMSQVLGRPVSSQRAWDWIVRLGFSLQRPRPRETRSDAATQEAWKKGGSASST